MLEEKKMVFGKYKGHLFIIMGEKPHNKN